MSEWDAEVFCLVAPDAVRRHLVVPILSMFAARGLTPNGWCMRELTSLQIDTMHEFAMVRSTHAYRFRCLDMLFALGPSILLRLADNGGFDGSPYARALEVKGASDPRDAAPGSIRYDLRAINVIMSLLHTSDGPAESRHESELLLDGSSWRDTGELGDLLSILQAGPAEVRLFPEALMGLRRSILTELWPALGAEARAEAGRLTAAGELAAPRAGEKIARLATCRGHPLLEILAAGFDQPVDVLRTPRTLGLDDWQTAVLFTSAYFPPRV